MSDFTPRQQNALKALLTTASVRGAAEACQVSERQLYRFLQDTRFRAELVRLEGQVLDSTVRRLVMLSGEAVEVMADVMSCPDQYGAGVRLRAAGLVLDHVLKLTELRTLQERVQNLEQVVYGKTGTKA